MAENPFKDAKKQIYSGICHCGHSALSHHGQVVMRQEYTDVTGESRVAGTCCAYGANENEGQGPRGGAHCYKFVDKDDPERKWKNVSHRKVRK